MIGRQSPDPGGLRSIVVTIPVIIALAEIRAQIVQMGLRESQLAGFKRIPTDTASEEGITIGESLIISRCAGHIDLMHAETASQTEKLGELLLPAADIREPVTSSYGT